MTHRENEVEIKRRKAQNPPESITELLKAQRILLQQIVNTQKGIDTLLEKENKLSDEEIAIDVLQRFPEQ
jgi:hypothetical protein